MLSPEADLLWTEYLGQERQKVRSETLQLLEKFINALEKVSLRDREAWALLIAEAVVDHKKPIPIRMPLFRKVLFPVLLTGYRKQSPGCARWLAGFTQLIHRSQECVDLLGPDDCTEYALLRGALVVDPSDTRAKCQLIKVMAWYLKNSIHEVPSGVLFNMNGATIIECDKLIEELSEFCTLVEVDGSAEEYQELIQECRLHFTAYPDYLAHRDQYVNYAEYLEQMLKNSEWR